MNSEINREMAEVRRETIEHLEAAYAMAPKDITPCDVICNCKWLDGKYESKEWRQVSYIMLSMDKTRHGSEECPLWPACNVMDIGPEFRGHVDAAEKLYRQFDLLGLQNALKNLTAEENKIIGECLRAIAYGPFLDDSEFHTLMGGERDYVARLAEIWPNVDDTDREASSNVNNAMNNMLGYPYGSLIKKWPDYISVPPQTVGDLLFRFRTLVGFNSERQKTSECGSCENME